MLKLLLATISILLATATSAYAKSDDLTISPNSDFSAPTENFSAGQTIYVKVNANSQGTNKHDLNLRDNSYNLISTFNLENVSDNTFKGSLPAPQNSGYYSLEAKVESPGANTTSVKTIKVGESTNSNVNVHVNIKSSGENVTSSNSTTSHTSTSQTLKSEEPSPSPTPVPSPTPTEQISQPEVQGVKDTNFLEKIKVFFENIFSSVF